MNLKLILQRRLTVRPPLTAPTLRPGGWSSKPDTAIPLGQIMNQKRPGLSLKKRITFGVCVTLAFFCLAEIGFRVLETFWPPRHVDFGLGFNDDSRIFVESSLHPVLHGN